MKRERDCTILVRIFGAAVVSLFFTSAALAVTVSSPAEGWAESAWSGDEVYRWGATARNMDYANGDWELGIGNDSAMSDDTAQFVWGGSGTSHTFVLSYDPLAATQATWTMNGQDPTLPNPAKPFTNMYIQLKGRPSASEAHISISDATLDVGGTVYNIGDFGAGFGESSDLMFVHIGDFGTPLQDTEFVLSGTLNIAWNGSVPSRDDMGLHVKFTNIPEPTAFILIGIGGLVVRRRRV